MAIGLPFFLGGLAWVNYTMEDKQSGMELYIGPLVFCAIGFIFSAIGVGVILNQRRQRLKREMLKRTGRKIKGIVTAIAKNKNIKVNNRHPHIVICTANVSGVDKTFKSNNIYGSLLLNKGDELDIYLDFRDYDNYWVEVPPEATR